MAENKVSACFFHDEKPSVVRCNVCMKPLCENCVLRSGNGSYCSRTCANNAEKAVEHINELNEVNARADEIEKKQRTQSFIINSIILFVIFLLFFMAWRFYWIPLAMQKQIAASVHKSVPFLDFVIKFLMGK